MRKIPVLTIAVVVIISIFLGYQIKNLRFNYVFESFFPTDDPELEYYREFEKMFENDNNYLLIGLTHESTIFDSTFLSKVALLSDTLSHYDLIKSVTSLTNVKKPIIGPAGYFNIPVVHTDSPELYSKDSIRIYKDKWLIETLISKDAKATAVVLKHVPITKEEADRLIAHVISTLDHYGLASYHLAGKSYAQGVFINKMQKELMIFLSASVVLIIIFLSLAFRSIFGVVIPLIVVLLATVWILGFMAFTGKSLDILMVLLPTIMFIVGMSDVVHIMTKYIEQLRLGESKAKAILITIKEVGVATFLTSLTTAVGFATLLTASIKPIREFGVYTATGVFFAFIVAFTLFPACLMLLPKPKISRKMAHKASWVGFLNRSFVLLIKNAKTVMAANVLVIAISLFGISFIYINTYLIEDLPSDDPLKQDFTFFDKEFGGSRPFELTATTNRDSLTVYSPEILKEINKVQEALKDIFDAGNVISPVTLTKGLNQALHGGQSEHYQLPTTDSEWKRLMRYLPRLYKGDPNESFATNDNSVARISARVGDIGSALSLKKTEELKDYIDDNTNKELVTFTVTGTSNLIDKNNENLAKNMFAGLGIAFLVVAIIAGLMFGSLRMIVITLIPNIIPLLLIAGIMGIFGITLKLSTSIVFSIAFGIAVDDTIHFISKLKIELAKGRSIAFALRRTYLSTGKAIIVTSIILSGGFLILLFSSFGGTFYTGLLVSMTLIFALISDLTLLPVLIMLFFKRKKINPHQ